VTIMRDDRKELFRKWAAIFISALALLLTCLTGPVAFTLRATMKDLLREELVAYETVAATDARWKAHQEYENEVLKRWEHDLAAVRERSALGETNSFRHVLEVNERLLSLETKLEQLIKQLQREGKSSGE